MKILSCGAGMQSSALHLMSCENALAKIRGEPPVWPQVPIYDISIFCDLGFEPPWVKKQVEFLANAGHSCGVPLVILDSPLYTDFMENFGERRTISIPWWTIKDKKPKPPMDSDLFISRSRKRLMDLTDEDCNDAECFEYCGMRVWNGF